MILITVDPKTQINTIQSALNLILEENEEPVTIYIKKGFYKEKIKITHPNITLVGEDKDETIISFDDYAKKVHKDGKEYNTFRTYTVMVLANNVSFFNLTIQNTSGYGEEVGQAVALHVNADKFSAFNCNFYARQDTIFNGPLPYDLIKRYEGFLLDDERNPQGKFRQYFDHCHIKGDVDFIFGCGTCIFDNCTITSLKRDNSDVGYVCAPAHPKDIKYGHIFLSCEFKSENCPPNSVYLARPWRDYGMATFINCLLGPHIKEEGFDKWNDSNRDQTARFYEYKAINQDENLRVKWAKQLSSVELVDYKMENIFGDWNPLSHRNEVYETFKSSQI